MKSLYSCSALSLAYPYFCCKSPKSFSFFPSTAVRSSSVSLPHFSLTPPLISFHFPFRTSSFMFALLSSCSLKQGVPRKFTSRCEYLRENPSPRRHSIARGSPRSQSRCSECSLAWHPSGGRCSSTTGLHRRQ